MTAENYNVIGVMSGTSLDGIDLAHIRFTIANGKWQFEILEAETVPYENEWLETLKRAVGFSADELFHLNIRYTKLLSGVVASFIEQFKLYDIDAVCSHGHTILHQPQNGVTLQIGNLPETATLINRTVICDFRVGDVNLGGQGAPLVPVGDRILFSGYHYCLNLGGFSNISFEEQDKRIAFDICAVNTVLNYYANELGYPYDDKGGIAASGELDQELLDTLNAQPYFRQPYPKSLGFESVKETILPLIEAFNIPTPNKLNTYCEHIAVQIVNALPEQSGKVLVTGGGAYNDFLINLLKQQLPKVEFVIPPKKILEFKEALVFALLGVLRLRNEVNVLSSVTGAKHDHSSGFIYKP
ncbi:MAG TPA: anhydro-N-acetylmuramic acid kinase [Flavobacterium sp.]|jgi:anhydro-N-acetylmuramic acid kinase